MSSTTSSWVDIQIKSGIDSGELLAALDDPDVHGAWQEEGSIHLYWPDQHWSPEHLNRLRRTLQRLNATDQPLPEIHVRSLENRDWNRQWADSVKPLRIGKRILIRPSWEPVDAMSGQIEIVLDPKRAFGTGHHATTRMLLEWLEELIQGDESVLDVGTGSGILAMVALRLGAARAVGIDHDPVAIECAREYAAINRFGEELSLSTGTLAGDRVYDLVLANLDRQTLLELVDKLSLCTKGRLLVSGLLLDQRQELVEVFARAELYPVEERKADGWLAMAFARAESCEGV